MLYNETKQQKTRGVVFCCMALNPLPLTLVNPSLQVLLLLVLSKMVTMVTLGDTTTRVCSPIKVREYVNVWFPSKYSSASAVVLKQYFLLVLSNGPRIIGPLDVKTSEASEGEKIYTAM